MSTYEGNEAAEITPQEENQLRRVHRLLCDYGAKKKVLKLLRPKQDQLEKLRQSADDEQADILVASEIQSLETDVEKLRQDLQEIEKKSDGLVSCVDLLEALKTLGRKAQKKDAEAMIWEVDEDLDGCVSWDEMRLMFQRNIRDTTGLEPSQLFNVVMFLIFDLDEDGMVSVDETMELLYARYGRHKMEDRSKPVHESNRRLHAIDATPARWRGGGGLSPLDGAPRKDSSTRPTHWLIYAQAKNALWG